MSDSAAVPSREEQLFAAALHFHSRGEIEAAKLHYLAVLQLNPTHFLALQNLGAALIALGKFHASVAVSRRAKKIQPKSLHVMSNLANALTRLRHYDEAEALLIECTRMMEKDEAERKEQNLALDESNAGIWHNYALVKFILGDYKKALAGFDKSLQIKPDTVSVLADRGLCLLSLGHIQDGLAAYEVRWEALYKSRIWELPIIQWQGEDLSGRHILVHHEQGFGDGIMFSRFLQNLNAMGATITVACPPSLHELYETNFPYVTAKNWEDLDSVGSGYDYHVPMMSLMRWLNIKSPADINSAPYLKAHKGFEFRPSLQSNAKKIGICWSSGNHGPNLSERRRDIPLELFLPLLEQSDVTLVSLQKGDNERDIVRCGVESLIHNPMGKIENFADTAAVIQYLDLVVTVDSAVAHLAGAMGKKVYMLGPYTRCWRWWSVSTGRPWYNDMKVFTQSIDGTWNAAVRSVVQNIKRGEYLS